MGEREKGGPKKSADQVEELWEALLGQLAHLAEEAEAVQAVIDRVPLPVQEGRPAPNDLSIKELYGLLALADEAVFLPQFQQQAQGEAPPQPSPDEAALAQQEDWHALDIHAILGRVQQARGRLIAFLEALPPEAWHRGVLALAHQVTQHDADVLRRIGYRLHESRLTDRTQDLPK